jgi:hypothetical protein
VLEKEEAGGHLKYGFDALLLLLPKINPTTPSASTINSLNLIAFLCIFLLPVLVCKIKNKIKFQRS